ncbi:hypothetical protein HYPSUDRAFT_417722 [Hypholoma sublateritium FD-334 SS-4]|uniref:Amino acid permease/ SLC12A domain-containing protein n=1 Tax=Hypholoma sublateritium (strain FD-334 SS-4) TaxID=945553 RepID=A0A0D2LD19_HYPSF|nr:hypothetical protein HYPSUDRAFT_417722 [Hypholoma sublateritium FD-334 SS-4]
MADTGDYLEKRASTASVSHDGGDEVPLGRTESKQELPKVLSGLQANWIGFNLIGIVPSIASTLVFSLPGGGTHGMIWAWLVCGVFMTVVSLAVAEIRSIDYGAGGMYHSIINSSSSKHKRLLAWIVGYANAIGNISSFAAISWACGLQIMAGSMIGSGFMFQPTMAQTFGVYCGLVILQGTACSLSSAALSKLQMPAFLLNILLWVVLVIALPVVTSPGLNDVKFVFGTFTNVNKAWSDNVFAFLLTFLSPIWVLAKGTTILHLGEESNCKRAVIPRAIIISALSNAILGWGLMIVLAFCMGNSLRAVLFSQSGEPMATILLNSFGKSAMLAAWSFIIVLQFKMGMNMLNTASRQLFAFSRDGALNYRFTKNISLINSHTNTPVTATWYLVGLSILGGLLAFAGSNAICRTLFSSAVVGQFTASTITIVVARSGSGLGNGRALNLRFMSLPIAIVATIFMTVLSVILLFPDTQNPSGGTMNYTVAILGAVLVLSIVDFSYGKHNGVPNYFK